MPTCAAIDLGSNSILLLIATITDSGTLEVVLDTGETTRLGTHLEPGERLSPDSVRKSLRVVDHFVSLCHAHAVNDIVAAGTQPFRLARDAQEFVLRVKNDFGISVRTLSFEEEARLSYLAVERDLSMPTPAVVMDVGGGSTEFLLPTAEFNAVSLPLGSVRLTEECIFSDPPRSEELLRIDETIRRQLQRVPKKINGYLVGIGGTLVTMGMIKEGHTTLDTEKVHGMRLAQETVDSLVTRLATASLADRKKIAGLAADRADIIVAGTMIVRASMAHMNRQELYVSCRGLRYGLLYEHFLG